MKSLLLINFLMLGVILNACTKSESVAGSYKKKLQSGDAEGAVDEEGGGEEGGGEEGGGEEGGGEEGGGEEGGGEEGGGEEGGMAEGDAEAGKAVIASTCSTCHMDGGAAAKVKLDASAVAKLDDAYTGTQKAFHQAFTDHFEGQGRADLEAALNAGAALHLAPKKNAK